MAGYTLDIKIEGFNEFKQKLEQAPQIIAEVKEKMIDRMVTIVRDRAVREAPIDTGNLRHNLIQNSKVKTFSGDFVGVVGTNLVANGFPYPVVQEFGSGVYGKNGAPIIPKRKRFLIFKPKGSKKYVFAKQVKGVKPKYFLKKGAEELKSRMKEILQYGNEIIRKLSFRL
jgi:HK97 gp10 family phage protein